MTAKNLRKSREKLDTHVTTVAQYGESMKQKKHEKSSQSKSSLRVLNDCYLIKEDPIELQHDKASGLTEDVVSAIKSSKLFVPETAEYYVKKYPMTGSVVSFGNSRKYNEINLGDKVVYGRLAGQRYKHEGTDYILIREYDILAIIHRP